MSDQEVVQVIDDDGTVLAEWPAHRKPGPRPVTCPTLKTSVRVLGERQVDEFHALCAWYGRRPHELAADFVLEAIMRHRRRKKVAEFVRLMVAARQNRRAVERGEVIDLEARRSR